MSEKFAFSFTASSIEETVGRHRCTGKPRSVFALTGHLPGQLGDSEVPLEHRQGGDRSIDDLAHWFRSKVPGPIQLGCPQQVFSLFWDAPSTSPVWLMVAADSCMHPLFGSVVEGGGALKNFFHNNQGAHTGSHILVCDILATLEPSSFTSGDFC